jgi:flagellar hook-associated protein 1 FlgK
VEKARAEYIAAGHTEAEALADITTATFTNADDTILRLTALNTAVSEVFDDPKKFAATTNINNGVDNYDNILGLLNLESKTILYRGNAADKFLQCIYADITVDTQECEVFKSNYTSIMDAIQAQRDSVSSVDEDEEAMDLVKFQNAYNLASKVIQTMTEMYDQLILKTGV